MQIGIWLPISLKIWIATNTKDGNYDNKIKRRAVRSGATCLETVRFEFKVYDSKSTYNHLH